MPLWIIYHPPSIFTEAQTKAAFAKAVTYLYSVGGAGLPAFYVNVFFQSIQPDSLYIGGVSRPSPNNEADKPGSDNSVPFVRVTIEHLARQLPNAEVRDKFLRRIDETMKPFIADAGFDWEYSIIEGQRELWKVKGMVPPMPASDAENEWVKLNEAVPFERVKGGLEGEGWETWKV